MRLSRATLWLLVAGINTLILAFFMMGSYTTPKRNMEVQDYEAIPRPKEFKDQVLAYQILTEFDRYKPTIFKDPEEQATIKKRYGTANTAILAEPDYCERVRENFVRNPQSLMSNMSFVTDHTLSSFLRKTIFPAIGLDPQPEINGDTKEMAIPTFPFRTDLSIFYGDFVLYEHMDIGKHFSCLTQQSNYIPGHYSLCRKDHIVRAFNEYVKEFKDRPECFNADSLFPRSWLMINKEECVEFFKLFNSPKYEELKKQKNIVYIEKMVSVAYNFESVFPVDERVEEGIRNTYKNGELCGHIDENVIMQDFISNPLLINGHKFDFRVFLLIASTNPVIAYYADGYLRHPVESFEVNWPDKTFYFYSPQLVDEKIMSPKELPELQSWTFQKMMDYFVETGIVESHDWLDKKLRPELQKAMIHLVRMSQASFDNTISSVYGFFGVDFMLDADLNLWFIEANRKPGLNVHSKEKKDLVFNAWKDQFEIVYGLLRSRMKRIMVFVNRLIENGEAQQLVNGQVQIANKEANMEEFARITRNYFEPEYQVSSGNMFVKIIDENENGEARYAGYIPSDCL